MTTKWSESADVVVVGYGGAGAATAITAHDCGVSVLILEKQPCDTSDRTNHVPSTRMSGGSWFAPRNAERTAIYIEALAKAANETVDDNRREVIGAFAQYLVGNTDWMKGIGAELGGIESMTYSTTLTSRLSRAEMEASLAKGRVAHTDYPHLPGSEEALAAYTKTTGKYRNGAALFKCLSDAVQKRNIPVMWATPAAHLVMQDGEVRGVIAGSAGDEVAIMARRAVVLTCGGFEFNDRMKENFLRAHPSHFYANPGNTGDGISMAMEVGAALWHMNNAAWRATIKPTEHPIAFGTQGHGQTIFVDKIGRRFTNENINTHAFGYELTIFDAHLLTYPRIPCYMIFDEKRRRERRLVGYHGACNPPGGVMGPIHYDWSDDNQKEIDRGWITKASTIEGLADKIRADTDNGELMSASIMRETLKRYNELCRTGHDADFGKPKERLQPIEDPPFYAVKLWPGGANTQGGPKRNHRGQILHVNGTPIPRLYSAGELGSIWGMLYQNSGNLAECITFGRMSGENAASEKASRS